MVGLGLRVENIFAVDSKGVIRAGRGDALDESKQRYCQKTEARTLAGQQLALAERLQVPDDSLVAADAGPPYTLASAGYFFVGSKVDGNLIIP